MALNEEQKAEAIKIESILMTVPLARLIEGKIRPSDLVSSEKAFERSKKRIESAMESKDFDLYEQRDFNFDEIYNQISSWSENSQNFSDVLNSAEIIIENVGVENAAIVSSVQDILGYLSSILPRSEYDDVFGHHVEKPGISKQLDFQRIYESIDNPGNVILGIFNNSFLPDEMESLENGYPEFLDFAKGVIVGKIAELRAKKDESMPVAMQEGIARLFGARHSRPITGAYNEINKQAQSQTGPIKFNSNSSQRMTPESEGGGIF